MKRLTKIILGLGFSAGLALADMPYDSVSYNTGTNSVSVTVTNVGNDLICLSSISAQFSSPYTGTPTVNLIRGSDTNLLFSIPMTSNTSFLITQHESEGIWTKKNDLIQINVTSNVVVIVNRKEIH